MSEQNFENHGKFVPSYHFFAVPVFLINFLWSLYQLRQLGISFEGIFGVILAAALGVLVFSARRFASDAELPVLARKVLDEKLKERKAINQLIKSWKPDYLRA